MRYIALTIGPIYKTLKNAKSTREIWGASYFFSFIMKNIIQKLLDKGVEEKDFVTPYVNQEKLEQKNGVGLFHDRMIFKSNVLNKEEFQKLVNEVLKEIEKESNGFLKYEILKNYLQLNIIELNKEFNNPLLDISSYLDSIELFYQAQLYHRNLLLEYISQKQTLKEFKNKFLVKDAFKNHEDVKFLSLPRIALNSLDRKDFEKEYFKKEEKINDEQLIMKEFIENDKYKDKIKPYNKYIAIVQADGDNMGNVLKKIGSDEKKLEKFSEALFDFCLDSTNKVKHFDGQMIYAGGDDLLFFAPIYNTKEDVKGSIFHLCNEISKEFEKKISPIIKDLDLEKKPTLSFGVSITYYKFPLYEARENAANLLFDKAKKGDKNQIAYKVIKHSGQVFEDIIKKDTLFEDFLEMTQFDEIDSSFLHSLYMKIEEFKYVLNSIKNDPIKIRNFYENYFDEDVHKKEFKEFLEKVEEFTIKAFNNKKDVNYIYSTLRFKKFLLGDKK